MLLTRIILTADIMPRRLSFFKVYGPADPVMEARRLSDYQCAMIPPPTFIPFEELYARAIGRERAQETATEVMIRERTEQRLRSYRATVREDGGSIRLPYRIDADGDTPSARLLRSRERMEHFLAQLNGLEEAKIVFEGDKPTKLWREDTPVVAAVDWSPPPIRPDCEFNVSPGIFPVLVNSFV